MYSLPLQLVGKPISKLLITNYIHCQQALTIKQSEKKLFSPIPVVFHFALGPWCHWTRHERLHQVQAKWLLIATVYSDESITVNRQLYYGESWTHYGQFWLYGQSILAGNWHYTAGGQTAKIRTVNLVVDPIVNVDVLHNKIHSSDFAVFYVWLSL